jgi:hypothetical protein
VARPLIRLLKRTFSEEKWLNKCYHERRPFESFENLTHA